MICTKFSVELISKIIRLLVCVLCRERAIMRRSKKEAEEEEAEEDLKEGLRTTLGRRNSLRIER